MDLAHRARAVAAPAAFAVGTGLLVIAGLLSVGLPETYTASHWALAWAGLDLASSAAALATWTLLRTHDPRAALSAVTAGALLLLDAWFDVCTAAPGPEHTIAVTEAVLVELPLAALALGLALHLLADRP